MNPAMSLMDLWPALAAGALGASIPSVKNWRLRAGLGFIGLLLVLFVIRMWAPPVQGAEPPKEWPHLLNALIFLPIGAGKTASGVALPDFAITRADGDGHRWAEADRDKYSGVRAFWHDKAGANRKSVLVGDSGDAKRLRATYNSAAEAREHAQAEWSRLQRGEGTFSYTLALGRADLFPEMRGTVKGFRKPQIDDATWLIAKASHSITGSGGFKTSLDLETAPAR